MSIEGNHELTLNNGQTVFIRSSEGNPNKVTMLTEQEINTEEENKYTANRMNV